MHHALVKNSSYQVLVALSIPKQFDILLTPADTYMIFDPTNALHFGQEVFLPKLVAMGHLKCRLTSE